MITFFQKLDLNCVTKKMLNYNVKILIQPHLYFLYYQKHDWLLTTFLDAIQVIQILKEKGCSRTSAPSMLFCILVWCAELESFAEIQSKGK
jgi:hypothetical protein